MCAVSVPRPAARRAAVTVRPRASGTRSADPHVKALLAAYYRLGHLVRELLKFGVVGGVAFVVDIGVFNLCCTPPTSR